MTKIQTFIKSVFAVIHVVSILFGSDLSAQTSSQQNKVSGYAPVNGLKMYYEIHGNGNPLILLHGSYQNININWGAMIPELSKSRKVIAIEMQGHGRTNDTKREFSYDSLANDLNVLMQYLKIDSADILGYSLGGTVAYKFAINNPKMVKKLIIISATYKTLGWQKEARNVFDMMKPEFLTNTPLKPQYDLLAPDKSNWSAFVSKLITLNRTEFDFGDNAIASIKSPVLLIAGDNDGLDKTVLMETYKLLGGCIFGDISGLPASQLSILPSTSHSSILMNSTGINSLVSNFLK
jgi:pimeloyl-ACP methyl ester carboxylesterase